MKDVILKYFGLSSSDIKNAQEYFKIADELELKLNKEEKKILTLLSKDVSTYNISTYLKIDEVEICQIISKIKKDNKFKNDKELIKKFKKIHSYIKFVDNEYEKYKHTKIKEYKYNNDLMNKYLLGDGPINIVNFDNNDDEDVVFIPVNDKLKYYNLD